MIMKWTKGLHGALKNAKQFIRLDKESIVFKSFKNFSILILLVENEIKIT